jgi:hypothetical protein
MQYSVELREHTESGDDYIENHYDFETKAEAVAFAKENIGELFSILDYEGRNFDPKDITHLA